MAVESLETGNQTPQVAGDRSPLCVNALAIPSLANVDLKTSAGTGVEGTSRPGQSQNWSKLANIITASRFFLALAIVGLFYGPPSTRGYILGALVLSLLSD